MKRIPNMEQGCNGDEKWGRLCYHYSGLIRFKEDDEPV